MAKRNEVVDVLRQRLVRAVATGALRPGDRLPSTRAIADELVTDPRVVAAAYRQLALEELVELRERSGVYLKRDLTQARTDAAPPIDAIVDMLADAAMQGYSATALANRLQDVVSGKALRVLVIATSSDQGLGLARELSEDFGLQATSVLAERAGDPSALNAMKRAQLLVTTAAHAKLVRSLAEEVRRPFMVVTIRSDLFEQEWSLWHGEPVHVVVLDPRFRKLVQGFLKQSGADKAAVRVHLASDDLSRIPPDAPTYVTQAARAHLGRTKIPGMLIPPTRLLDDACVRAIWKVVAGLKLR